MTKFNNSLSISNSEVTLNVLADQELKPRKGDVWLDIWDKELKKEVFIADNDVYLLNLKENKQDLKETLKEKGLYRKGIIKEIKELIKEGQRLNFL